MDNFTHNETIKFIKDYINLKTFNYAILINGEWGSGKTHFIKNWIAKDNETERKGIYVSLYGLETIEELANNISLTIIQKELNLQEKNKIIPGINFALDCAKDFLKSLIKSEKIDQITIDKISNGFIDYSNYYFIFDDLERCSIDINTILGYINNFVEQNNAKVIIIANEADIEDEKYHRTKEKVIGKIILFKPELDNIINVLFNNLNWETFIDCQLKKYFIDKINEIMKLNDYTNLRTVQIGLEIFNRIIKLFPLNDLNKIIYNEIMQDVLESIFNIIILYKKDGKMIPINENLDYEYGRPFKNNRNYITFNFICNYIYYSKFTEAEINNTLEKYYNETELNKKKEEENDPLLTLNNYLYLEDNDILDKLKDFYVNFDKNKYDPVYYEDIILTLYNIKNIGFVNVKFDEYFDKIEEKVRDGETFISRKSRHMDEKDPVLQYFRKLEKLALDIKNKDYINKVNKIFKEDNWGHKFYNLVNHEIINLRSLKNLFSYIEIESCYEAIKENTIKEIYLFIDGVNLLYGEINSFKDVESELENLTILREKIESDIEKIESRTRKKALESLVNNLIRNEEKIQFSVELNS